MHAKIHLPALVEAQVKGAINICRYKPYELKSSSHKLMGLKIHSNVLHLENTKQHSVKTLFMRIQGTVFPDNSF